MQRTFAVSQGYCWKGALQLLALLLCVTILWAGNDPWKSKPYQQWTEKDLENIYAYSPWSHTASLTRTWLPLKAEEMPQIIEGGTRKLPTGMAQSDEGTLGAEVNFNVYWMSARVMRAASARQRILKKQLDEAKADAYVNQPLDEYQIVIQGADLVPFYRHDEKFYQANSHLALKKTKQKISPGHVTYERGSDGVKINAVVFHFAKKTPSGDPTIAAGEKSAEFTCKIEGSTLRVNFEPQKMVDASGPDL